MRFFLYIVISPLSFSRCLSLSLPMFVGFVVYTPGLGGVRALGFLGSLKGHGARPASTVQGLGFREQSHIQSKIMQEHEREMGKMGKEPE